MDPEVIDILIRISETLDESYEVTEAGHLIFNDPYGIQASAENLRGLLKDIEDGMY